MDAGVCTEGHTATGLFSFVATARCAIKALASISSGNGQSLFKSYVTKRRRLGCRSSG